MCLEETELMERRLKFTLQENIFQGRPNIARKSYSLKEMSELGKTQLNKSTVCAHWRWMSHSFVVWNVTPYIFLPDVCVKASLWLNSVYFLCMTAAEWDCFGSVTKRTTRALLPMSGFYWPQCDCHCVGVWLRNKANVTVTFFRGKSHIYFIFSLLFI